MELKQLKGIGEKTEKTLNRAGIEKVEDLYMRAEAVTLLISRKHLRKLSIKRKWAKCNRCIL